MADFNEQHQDQLARLIKHTKRFSDEAGILPAPAKRPLTGEQRLALRLVSDSVEESFGGASLARDEARAWLRTQDCPLSARMCFEALDFDYAAVMTKLERRWRETQ